MTDNGQIIWEDPPAGPSKAGIWVQQLLPVMERPGQWARVKTWAGTGAKTAAWGLNRGKYQMPPGRWEFVARQIDPEHTAVYARYLGPEEP